MNNKIITTIVFISIFFLHKTAYSQTVQGRITNPLTSAGIPNLTITIGDCTAVTDSLGHYLINLRTQVSVEMDKTQEILPTEYSLFQNYPNPFNSETTISFQLPKTSNVKIKIYNIYGQEIKTILEQKKEMGSHKENWDGTDNSGYSVSSGIYIIYLSTQEFRKSIKSILLK